MDCRVLKVEEGANQEGLHPALAGRPVCREIRRELSAGCFSLGHQ